jgi:nucleoid-associated protein YgaU
MMQKDFKIGLFIGVSIAIATIIWLCTLPKLSTIARAMQSSSDKTSTADPPQQISQPVMQPPVSAAQVIAIEPKPTMNYERPASNNQQSSRIHVVLKGDTLSKIAEKYYGSPRSWQKIVAANRDNLPDPNRLTPGSRLVIP